MKRYLMGLTVPLALTVAWPGAANAVAGWAIDPMPLPAGVSHGVSTGVACQAADNCIAVGTGSVHALAWHWNGSAWAGSRTAVPAGARSTGLSGVSCPSALECIAVGAQATGSTPLPLAERWDGARWNAQSPPSPGGTFLSQLDAVSCDSPNSCTAVGDAEGGGAVGVITLAEHWNGITWTVQHTPNPPDGVQTFAGVSCPSPADCFAVGSTNDGLFAESWNGASWKLMPVPVPAGGTFGELTGISCAGASTCTAVGSYLTGKGAARPLAERLGSGTWTPKTLPLPATATNGISLHRDRVVPPGLGHAAGAGRGVERHRVGGPAHRPAGLAPDPARGVLHLSADVLSGGGRHHGARLGQARPAARRARITGAAPVRPRAASRAGARAGRSGAGWRVSRAGPAAGVRGRALRPRRGRGVSFARIQGHSLPWSSWRPVSQRPVGHSAAELARAGRPRSPAPRAPRRAPGPATTPGRRQVGGAGRPRAGPRTGTGAARRAGRRPPIRS